MARFLVGPTAVTLNLDPRSDRGGTTNFRMAWAEWRLGPPEGLGPWSPCVLRPEAPCGSRAWAITAVWHGVPRVRAVCHEMRLVCRSCRASSMPRRQKKVAHIKSASGMKAGRDIARQAWQKATAIAQAGRIAASTIDAHPPGVRVVGQVTVGRSRRR